MSSSTQPDATRWVVDETIKPDSLDLSVVYHTGDETQMGELYQLRVTREEIAKFRKLWHYLQAWDTQWMGVQIAKYPTDLFVYQLLMVEQKFDLIIECGTFCGGSALYFAQMCQLIGHGRVISIDIEDGASRWPKHPNIEYRLGSSTAPETVEYIAERVAGKKALVVLDSDHSRAHVLAELQAYAPLAAYLVVEDTNVNGHPIRPAFKEGPGEAVAEFLHMSAEGMKWERDLAREKFLLTSNPGGYLKRK